MFKRVVVIALLLFLAVSIVVGVLTRLHEAKEAVAFCKGKMPCGGHDALIENVRVLQQQGARPSWSPDGKEIVFDRQNADGYSDVYLMNRNGKILRSLTEGHPGIGQENNGNAVFAPSGKYVVFISEAPSHYLIRLDYLSDPGLGIFCNLWATDLTGTHFWQLTHIPIKQSAVDPTPFEGVVNPHFSPDGKHLIWTERYKNGGNLNWGYWRIMMGDFVANKAGVTLDHVKTVYVPAKGNYVTAMGVISATSQLVLAGNLDGQSVYGMDQYLYDLETKKLVNLQHSPTVWEEDASITPHGHIIYMTDVTSRDKLNFKNPDWPHQPREREYFMMDLNGQHKTELTYFNDSYAPEYLGRRVIVAASSMSPNGTDLLGTLGVDFGTKTKANIDLKIVLITFKHPV